ncbi:MAG TPA: VIT domain-containing protein, partial [Pirellulaceae bacterium]|nr:VIT domain-containing protein [Pirellulaceae bacterium]
MHRKSWILYGTWCLFVAWVMASGTAWPQDVRGVRPWGGQVIVPQCWRPTQTLRSPLTLTQVTADIDIRDQMATTILLFTIQNSSKSQQMAEFVVPVPRGTVVRGFTFDGAGQEPKTELLERDLARATFDAIVAKLRDPALLEFAGYDLIRTSVFPVPAEGEQKVRLVMEQLLPNDHDRIDYLLPRSQSLTTSVPWSVTARLRSTKDIATVYSPSHEIAVRMVNTKEATLSIPERAQANPGAFRFSYLQKTAPLSASLMTYPSPDGNGGYFLLLAGLGQEENRAAADAPKIRREITLVLDRSGSMQGEKIEQARQAAWQVLSGLEMGEAFNIITFNDQIESFSATPVIKSAETLEQAKLFIDSIRADSGTNLHDALLTALKSPVTEKCLPIVLFLTDGLATVGQTSELAIRAVAEKENPHHRRVFTFGVGFDVNTPLL